MANHNPLDPLHRDRQLKAIEIKLATAPKVQEDLKAKFNHGENIFFYNDLVEYRMHNSALDVAEDLDLEERYDLINDQPISSVGYAFRGYDGEHFPAHEFDGLLGKVTNEYITAIRKRDGGRATEELGVGIYGRTPEKHFEDSLKGGRASAEAQGKHVWSLEEIVDIHNFREESIGKGRYSDKPSWDYITDEMNEKHDENWSTNQVSKIYYENKDKLSDEE